MGQQVEGWDLWGFHDLRGIEWGWNGGYNYPQMETLDEVQEFNKIGKHSRDMTREQAFLGEYNGNIVRIPG